LLLQTRACSGANVTTQGPMNLADEFESALSDADDDVFPLVASDEQRTRLR
jgi:hypothetical protein